MNLGAAIYRLLGILIALCVLAGTALAQGSALSETPEYKARIDEGLGLAFTEPDRAREISDELFAIFSEANDPVGQAITRRMMAMTYAPGNEWETVRKFFLEALTYINEVEHTELYVRNLQSIAASYINVGLYGKAFEYNSQALSISEKYEYQEGIARSSYFIGVIMVNIYDNKAAIEYQTRAVESGHLPLSTLVAAYKSLGNAYRYDGQPDKALGYYERSVSAAPDQGPFSLAITYQYHADALTDLARFDEADVFANKALELSEENGFAEYRCRSRQTLGRIALGRGEPEQALALLDLKNCALEDVPEEYQIATDIEILPHMIRAQLSIGQTQDALAAFDQLLESQEKNFNTGRANALGIAEARLQLAQSEGRVAFLEQQEELSSVRLRQRGLIAFLAVLSAFIVFIAGSVSYRNYQIQKRTNSVLRNNNLITANKAMAAEKSLEHKTLLIHEINHRVKNNLQTIISLLNTQRRRLGPAATDAASDILKDIRGRVETMAIVQQSLNELEGADHLQSGPFIQNLVSSLITSSGQKVETVFDVEDMSLSADTAAPLALIINELVSNALKHAFQPSRQNRLSVTLQPTDDGHYQLTCRDNGVGLKLGFDLETLDSFGLSIVGALAEQIYGQLAYDTGNPGTIWMVRFRVEDQVANGETEAESMEPPDGD